MIKNLFKLNRHKKGISIASYPIEMGVLGLLIVSTIFAVVMQVSNIVSSRAISNDYEKAVMLRSNLAGTANSMKTIIEEFYNSNPDALLVYSDTDDKIDFQNLPCKRNMLMIQTPIVWHYINNGLAFVDKVKGTNLPAVFTPNSNFSQQHPNIVVNESNKIFVLSCQKTLWTSKRMIARVY